MFTRMILGTAAIVILYGCIKYSRREPTASKDCGCENKSSQEVERRMQIAAKIRADVERERKHFMDLDDERTECIRNISQAMSHVESISKFIDEEERTIKQIGNSLIKNDRTALFRFGRKNSLYSDTVIDIMVKMREIYTLKKLLEVNGAELTKFRQKLRGLDERIHVSSDKIRELLHSLMELERQGDNDGIYRSGSGCGIFRRNDITRVAEEVKSRIKGWMRVLRLTKNHTDAASK